MSIDLDIAREEQIYFYLWIIGLMIPLAFS